jgi:8-oxo-dGTP pyrophosphatase MutT (NUDIX family)
MPEEALRRELVEEVGLAVSVDALLNIFPMAGASAAVTGIVLAYAAQPQPQSQPGPHSGLLPELCCQDDVVEAGWFGVGDLPGELAFQSTVTLLARWQDTFAEQK